MNSTFSSGTHRGDAEHHKARIKELEDEIDELRRLIKEGCTDKQIV